MSTSTSEQSGPEIPTCSAKGCQQAAVWDVVWNNPKLHTPDRRKSWLACDEHRESLSGFLAARSFLIEVVPLEDPAR
jgi:hypothetical protein